jgi:signal transduction histidine kinase
VRVEAASGGDVVRLRVIDSGPGVSEEDREQMFSPFQRLGDRSTGGVGLGLAIARGFTEAMNGTLSPSTTPGGGLTMTLTLPAAAS